ncbi:hypothetical protein TSMEX_002444 [Taenia solium]|eukprot:TsM_000824200 transcript=TsM_000824200 gene=TsM_000824200
MVPHQKRPSISFLYFAAKASMGRKNSSSRLPIDNFRRAIGDNQRRRQMDQVARLKTSIDKKNENKQVETFIWALTISLFLGMVVSVAVIAGMKYVYEFPNCTALDLPGHLYMLDMEWDEVETNGLLQPFETSVVAALVELRQRHWKECTNVINNFESGLSRVNSEKADLVKELEKCNCMIEGKELEILGLRRQLKSLHMARNLCKKCDCEAVAAENQADKIPAETSNPRKRTRFNLSASTSLESSTSALSPPGAASAFLHRRPSEKRFCLATTNGQLAVDLNKSKSKDTNEEPNVLVAETQNDLSPAADESLQSTKTLTNGTAVGISSDQLVDIKPEFVAIIADSRLNERGNDVVSHCPFGLATFSPPSQMFDASLALRRAVNHLDLANYEPSTIAPLPSARPKQSRFKNGAQRVHSSRQAHKRTCRHYKPQPREADAPKGKPKPIAATDMLSDATGADLTFPSISTAALATDVPSAPLAKSLMPPPPPPATYSTMITRRMSKKPSADVLPSVGRSPTSEKNIENQLDASQDNHLNNDVGDSDVPRPMAAASGVTQVRQVVRYSREEVEKCLRGPESHRHSTSNTTAALPSTPDGYWNVGNLEMVSPEPGVVQPAEELAVRRPRRRRPLEFPKPPT